MSTKIILSALSLLALLAVARSAEAEIYTFATEPLPPFQSEENGKVVGPTVEILYAVCAAAGIQCRAEVMPWRRALSGAQSGQADGLVSTVDQPDRREVLYITRPVLETAYGLFVAQDSHLNYTTPTDLVGYTLGVYGPSGTSTAAEKLAVQVADLKVSIEVTNEAALRMLSGGRYGAQGAAMMNRDFALALIRTDTTLQVKLAGEVTKVNYCIGLSRQKFSPAAYARFAAALDGLIEAGRVKEILDRYDLTAPGEPPPR